MIALAVDDESWALKTLTKAVQSTEDISEIHGFSTCNSALQWANENKFDIAFLDVNMRGMGGIELAKSLRLINPGCFVIFCTGFQEYAIDAFKIHADGYLLKPIDEKDVREELSHLLKKNRSDALLKIRCFGGFEVLTPDGSNVVFRRSKAKEVLAVLVDKKGMGVTSKELCTILWEDDYLNDKKNMQYLWNVLSDLSKTLREAGAEDVIIHSGSNYSVDTSKIECDYYEYLSGRNRNADPDDYMPQYSWAEYSIANMHREK